MQITERLKRDDGPKGYSDWLLAQGMTVQPGNYQHDLTALELFDWPRLGGRGAILNHDRSAESNDCWVVDIAAGGSLRAEKHLFEEVIYVLSGRGATRITGSDGSEQVFEWQEGSLFSVPLNVMHQHFNGQADKVVRLLIVTNAPAVLNLFESDAFVFGCDYEFRERYAGDSGYFSTDGHFEGRVWHSNFVSDVRTFELLSYPERGGGGRNVHLSMAGNTMKAHISEFAVGNYKKAHRHGAGAHVVVLSGTGYSLMWREGEEPTRYDWSEGSLIVPPDNWFHQHFNIGDTPARYLALRYIDTQARTPDGIPMSSLSTKLGGNQIEYEDESPVIRKMFDDARRS